MAEQVVAEYKLDVDQAVKGLDKLQSEYAKTEAASRKAAQTSNDSFIKGSEGAKRLDAELKKQPKTLAEMELKLRNLRELLRDDTKIGTEGFKKIRAEIDKTEKEVQKLNGDLKKTGTEMSGLGGIAKKVGGFLIAAFAVDRVIAFGKEVIMLAAQAEGVERAFARIGSPQLLQGLRDATRGTVSDLVLMQNAVKASNFKIPLESLASLFKFAQARARETGESVDYLVDSIILGIGRKSPLILDNLGISSVELRTRLKGVGVEAANVGDIAAIIGDIATEELAKMGDQADTTADKIAQIGVKFENFKVAVGKDLIGTFQELNEEVEITLQLFDVQGVDAFGLALKVVQHVVEDLTNPFILLNEILQRFGGAWQLFKETIGLGDTQLEKINKTIAENQKQTMSMSEAIAAAHARMKQLNAETEPYVRSLNQLNKELKELQKSFESAEVGGVDFYRLADAIEAKIKEIDRAMRSLAERKYANQPDEEIATFNITEIDAQETTTDLILKDYEYRNDEIEKALKKRNKMEADAAEKRKQEERDIQYEITQQTLSTISQMVGAISQIQQNAFMVEQQELQKQLEQGLITREEFDRRELAIRRKAAQSAKDAALFQAIIGTAQAVINALNTQPFLPMGPVMAALAGSLGAVQIAAIASTPLPQFAEGVIGLKGAGTETSDSIHAKLSKGESVMTAAETKRYNAELWAIRNGNFEDLIITKYVRPMIDESLFNGFGDIAKSAQLNGLTANLKDHNILAAIDRDRQATVYGLNLVAGKLDKLSRTNSRRGW